MRIPAIVRKFCKGRQAAALLFGKGCQAVVRLACVIVLICSALPIATAAEAKYALIIGNDSYEGDFSPLPTCVNDAREMERCLNALGYKTTVLTNATRPQMMDAVHAMQERLASGDATGIFFYSGHAVAIGGESYLVPARTNVSPDNITFREECLSVSSISKLFKANCPRSLLFLDACRDIVHSDTKGGWSPSKNVVRGKGNEQVICYATSYGKVARAGKDGLSPFTQVLTTHLFDPESFMSVWLHKVEGEVETLAGQTPVLEGGFSSDFFFNPTGNAAPSQRDVAAKTEKPEKQDRPEPQKQEQPKPQPAVVQPGNTTQAPATATTRSISDLIAEGRLKDNSSATIARAIEVYRQAAELGDPEAMYLLGKAYTFGNKATKDKTQARLWLDRAEATGASPWAAMAASLKRTLAL